MNKVSRSYGIDLLRIVSILGVCFLHVLGHGGILASANTLGRFSLVWMLEILAYPAVNCFVLISGYVGYRESRYYPRLKNIISLFFTVVFYGALLCLIFKAIYPALVSKQDFFSTFTPIKNKNYWFFSAYAGMFVLSPVLNAFVHRTKGKYLFCFLLAIAAFSLASLKKDPFLFNGGYSVIWFVLLYFLGAIIKKYDLTSLLCAKAWVCVAVASLLLTWAMKTGGTFLPVRFLQENRENLVAYDSPTVVLMAVCWLGAFSKIKCGAKAIPAISFFASSAFSVYLIHDNIFVRNFVISKIHLLSDKLNALTLAPFIVLCVLLVFVLSTLIDKVRICLFNLVKVDKISQNIEDFIKKVISAVYNKIKQKAEKNNENL